jgi:ATPase family associated with various cellular activities (AAA)
LPFGTSAKPSAVPCTGALCHAQCPVHGGPLQRRAPLPSDACARHAGLAVPKAITYADMGGIEGVLADIREVIEYPLRHPEVYAWLGVEPPRGVLLHGPPGCGKTALAHAIANECGVPFLRVSAPEVVAGMSGAAPASVHPPACPYLSTCLAIGTTQAVRRVGQRQIRVRGGAVRAF